MLCVPSEYHQKFARRGATSKDGDRRRGDFDGRVLGLRCRRRGVVLVQGVVTPRALSRVQHGGLVDGRAAHAARAGALDGADLALGERGASQGGQGEQGGPGEQGGQGEQDRKANKDRKAS